jgi:peptidase M15-like protein
MKARNVRPTNPLWVAVAVALAAWTARPAADAASDHAVFTLVAGGVPSTYDTAAMFVLPGERVPIEARGRRGATYAVRARDGELTPGSANRWTWRAPAKPGVYTLSIIDATSGKPRTPQGDTVDGKDVVTLNAFVMVPADRVHNGRLNGYRIGEYPPGIFRENPVYRAPRGFVEVTKDNLDEKVSPHFKIGQFLCKQPDAFPKYVVLDERLPVKLENVVDRLRALGYDLEGLTVMSGYRTPFYNKAIGNVTFSMHQFGGAADVFVDKNHDGRMDDLNADRTVDRRDAVRLFDIVDRMSRQQGYLFQGGLGYYPATPAHGPFVHVDVRGNAARWAE